MRELEGKRLLILGGSLWRDQIKKISNRYNIHLIAAGNNTDSGIFSIADEGYRIDSTDQEGMKKFIIEKRIDGVYLGGSETVINNAIDYVSFLDMPVYATKTQWNKLQNKSEFKNLCKKFDLPVTQEFRPNNIQKSDFPVIVKPEDGSGSNGFSICRNIEELKQGIINGELSSESGRVIIEEYVDNRSMIVFYTFSNGKAIFTGSEDKHTKFYEKHGTYVASEHKFPSCLEDKFRDRFEKDLIKMFDYLEIKEGTIWLEIFTDSYRYFFNEAGFRYSGSVSIFPIYFFYQINQVANDISYALTGKSRIYDYPKLCQTKSNVEEKYAILSIHLNPGKIYKILGMDDIVELKNVIAFPVTKKENDIVPDTGTISQVYGFIHFIYESNDEYENTISIIKRKFKVLDSYGNDMVINP